jgi:hypothetical protein
VGGDPHGEREGLAYASWCRRSCAAILAAGGEPLDADSLREGDAAAVSLNDTVSDQTRGHRAAQTTGFTRMTAVAVLGSVDELADGMGGCPGSDRRSETQRDTWLAGVALVTVLVFPLAGCATGKVRLSMQRMCQSHGGTWSQAQETCGTSATEARQAARQAKDICAEQGECISRLGPASWSWARSNSGGAPTNPGGRCPRPVIPTAHRHLGGKRDPRGHARRLGDERYASPLPCRVFLRQLSCHHRHPSGSPPN